MKCPLCGTQLSNKFALATGKSVFRCNGCGSALKAEIESLDKVSTVCGKTGFLISVPVVALLTYKALSTGIYLPYVGYFCFSDFRNHVNVLFLCQKESDFCKSRKHLVLFVNILGLTSDCGKKSMPRRCFERYEGE